MDTKTHRLGLDFAPLNRDELIYGPEFITPAQGSVFIYEIRDGLMVSLEVINTEDADGGHKIYTTLRLKHLPEEITIDELNKFLYHKWCN